MPGSGGGIRGQKALYDGGQLIFRAMPRGPRDQGAQLVSEPIRFPGPDEKQDSWWSVTLSITLQSVPFDPLPRFNLRWSVRRWATRTNAKTGRLRLPWGASTTVLLRPRRPFLPGTPVMFFAVLQEGRWPPGPA